GRRRRHWQHRSLRRVGSRRPRQEARRRRVHARRLRRAVEAPQLKETEDVEKREHTPVLLGEVVELLAPERGGFFVDATVGAGGHAEALLERGPRIRLLGLDRDPEALELARRRLARFGDRVELAEENFARLDSVLAGRPAPDGILADLGVSSMQLERAERGFSFRREGPLDMRMSKTGRTAAQVVAEADVSELSRILRESGEERMA